MQLSAMEKTLKIYTLFLMCQVPPTLIKQLLYDEEIWRYDMLTVSKLNICKF